MKTDDLIHALTQDTTEARGFGRLFGVAMAGSILIAGLLFFILMGPRDDFAEVIQTVRFPFKFVVTLTLAISAMGLALRLARPGVPLGPWRWALGLAPLLLAVAALTELTVVPASSWGQRLIGTNIRFCLTLIPLLSAGPLICLLVALRRGAPTYPGATGAVAGLVASGVAATFYAANCTDDSPLFVITWYPIAIGVVTLIGYVAGRRWLRW